MIRGGRWHLGNRDGANRVAVAEIEEHGVDDGVSRGRLTISQGARRTRTSALAILATAGTMWRSFASANPTP